MVLLVERLGHSLKLFSNLENHIHHSSNGGLSASLQAFRSNVSNCLKQKLSINSIPRSDFLSLIQIQQLLELISDINKAFAKLAMEIDYPMSQWEMTLIEEYLEYSLNLLEHLNSISFSLSHISQSRVSLSHALSLVKKSSPLLAIEHLKPIQTKCLGKDFKDEENREKSKEIGGQQQHHHHQQQHGKVWVVEEALMVMKRIELWVCGIILSGLYSDIKKPYVVDCGGSEEGFVECILMGSWEWKMGNGNLLKEVKDVNDAVEILVGKDVDDEEAKELLERRLEMIEKLVEGVDKDSNSLFSEVLAARNKLLDSFSSRSKDH